MDCPGKAFEAPYLLDFKINLFWVEIIVMFSGLRVPGQINQGKLSSIWLFASRASGGCLLRGKPIK
jgi:hypothetical protein